MCLRVWSSSKTGAVWTAAYPVLRADPSPPSRRGRGSLKAQKELGLAIAVPDLEKKTAAAATWPASSGIYQVEAISALHAETTRATLSGTFRMLKIREEAAWVRASVQLLP